MTNVGRSFLTKRAFGAATALLVIGLLVPAAAGPGGSKSCSVLDGRYDVGTQSWVEGIEAPGIAIVSASDRSVAFQVEDGYLLSGLCVRSGKTINTYQSDTTLPVEGPSTITLTRSGPGYPLVSVSFDTEMICEPAAQAPLTFEPPVFIDAHRDGGEPVSIVAEDGSLIAGAHLGTTLINPKTIPDPDWVTNYGNQTLVWRSTDEGKTWQHIEFLPGSNMHSVSSTGFSDPDFAMDAGGNLYGTEIDLANVAVFSSHDNGQTWPDANVVADSGDRPWLAGREDGVVYLRITGNLQKSVDGGATWTQLTDPPNAYGKLMADPTDPEGLFIPVNPSQGAGVVVSRDDGNTWTTYRVPGSKRIDNTTITGVGVDSEGWVYEGYIQGTELKFSSWNPSTTEWSAPVTIPRTGSGSRLSWVWTVAGDAGRAAVGWYELVPVTGQTNVFDIRPHIAVTENARGSTIGCPDGSSRSFEPSFSVSDAVGRAIYRGPQPCTGTGCNITGDRRLGDFFTINFDQEGKVFLTTGDTTILGPAGQPNTQSHPLFSIATDSSPRLVAPGSTP